MPWKNAQNGSAPCTPQSVLIIDGSPLVCEGIAALVERELAPDAVRRASSLSQAICHVHEADLVITDVELPDAEHFTVVPLLTKRAGRAPVLVVTDRADIWEVERTVAAGARGYILKSIDLDGFRRALQAVVAGHLFLQSELGGALYGPGREDEPRPFNLTECELQLLSLIAYGYTNMQAAQAEHVSLRTIEGRRARLRTKLDCDSRAALTAAAHQLGVGVNGMSLATARA
jgi:DNA-binding NarL/FixJ family response regulator